MKLEKLQKAIIKFNEDCNKMNLSKEDQKAANAVIDDAETLIKLVSNKDYQRATELNRAFSHLVTDTLAVLPESFNFLVKEFSNTVNKIENFEIYEDKATQSTSSESNTDGTANKNFEKSKSNTSAYNRLPSTGNNKNNSNGMKM